MSSAASTKYTKGWRTYRRLPSTLAWRGMPSLQLSVGRRGFALKETEFGMSASQIGRKRVFDDGSQGGVSHDKPSVAPAFEVVGQQPECVGVSFEMNQVVPFPFAEPVPVRGVAVGPQPVAFAFAEASRWLSRPNVRRADFLNHVPGRRPTRWHRLRSGGFRTAPDAFCRSAREISLPKERPTLDTSRLWVSRLWTNTLPGSGNTCVLFCKR